MPAASKVVFNLAKTRKLAEGMPSSNSYLLIVITPTPLFMDNSLPLQPKSARAAPICLYFSIINPYISTLIPFKECFIMENYHD